MQGRTLSVACGERDAFGTNPLSLAALDSSPEGRALGKEGKSRPHPSTARRSQLISGKLYALAKASPFRERWHGEAVTERVASRTNPLSRLRRQLVPLFVAWRRHLPPAGGSLSTQGGALGKEGEFRPHPSTARRSQPLSCKLYAFAKASPSRERWHGQRPRRRGSASRTNPLSLASFASSPEGEALRL